ncbi:hypothetical protein A0H81_13963 [Grifola frondosa]|uniref:Xylanolytic transcriptional activator regulatory domain-containing protein n=1 Tax=Grifola frondosa TaxID=5627 RepID=A0A1C7LMV1_GRIFR|nr:hypothetical protein A0H81_13963 [Grifola frondosa]
MDHRNDPTLAKKQTAFIALVCAVFAVVARLVEDPHLSKADNLDDAGMGMAWLLVGQAVRSAQDIGLHRSPRRLLISPIEKETRRKVWWGVYTLDQMLALAFGRPLAIEDADCDVELAIAGQVLRQVYALDKCKDNLELEKCTELQRAVDSLDKSLTKWCDDLPSIFKSNPITEKQVTMAAVLCSHYYSILTTLRRNFLPVRRDQPIAPARQRTPSPPPELRQSKLLQWACEGVFQRIILGVPCIVLSDGRMSAPISVTVSEWLVKSRPRKNWSRDVHLSPGRHRPRSFVPSPFTNDFPRADIHELIAPDILHQLIKGTFKDHLVDWVEQYLVQTHGKSRAQHILADIDRRIAVVPPFSGLRKFHEGRGFKQWTGDDSKALMKVYLPAIVGHVPREMVRAIRAFLEFCYIVRRNVHTPKSLRALQDALDRFHHYRTIFQTTGVRLEGFSLPRQHSLVHYQSLIWAFGAPNGLCSSITESKHIEAVKEPWRRSSRNEPMASHVDFKERQMLNGSCLSEMILSLDADIDPALQPLEEAEILREAGRRENNDADDGAVPGPTVLSYVVMAATIQRKHARLAEPLGIEIGQPRLPELIRRFLYDQYNPTSDLPGLEVPLDECPRFKEKVSVFYSAAATYYAPSDPSGTGGMHREHIRATPLWWGTAPRFDCIFVNRDADIDGFLGLGVARVLLFFSFTFNDIRYPCALVHWFKRISDEPDEDTGMYIVKPETKRGSPVISVIHLDSIVRAAHLIGVYGSMCIPTNLRNYQSLDAFRAFYFDKHSDATDPFFLPESPRHLLGTGRESEARKVVAELNGVPEDDPVVVDIVEELEVGIKAENEGSKSTWMECFSARNGLWKRTINGMVLRFVRQLNGQNFYYYYGNTFFKSAGTTPSTIQAILGGVLALRSNLHDYYLAINLPPRAAATLSHCRPTLLQNAKVWTAQQNGTEVILADILLDNGLIKGIRHVGCAAIEAYNDLVVIDLKLAWVMPGIVDLHSHLGDTSSPELDGASGDDNSLKGPVRPWLHALDSLNMHDESHALSIAGGATTAGFTIKLRKTPERSPSSMLLEPPYKINTSFLEAGGNPRWHQMKHACIPCDSRSDRQANASSNSHRAEPHYNKAREIKEAQDQYCANALRGDWDTLTTTAFPEDIQMLGLVNAGAVQNKTVQHGAALRLGVAGMGGKNAEAYDDLKETLFADSTVAGEAIWLCYGSDYARLGTRRSFIVTIGLAFIFYGRQEEADDMVKSLMAEKVM